MSENRVFVDTNILLYAIDAAAGSRQSIADASMHELWESGRGIISTQVLQEFYAVATRKIPKTLSIQEARGIVRDLIEWEVVVNNSESVLRAIDLQERYGYSFWDCLIIDAAIQSAADLLLSEDLPHGLEIGGVQFVNPFIPSDK